MKLNSIILTVVLFFAAAGVNFSQNSHIGDTIDVLNYDIHLNLVHLSTHRLAGYTTVKITPKQNSTDLIKLYLLKLTVDSIYYGNSRIATFSYNDTIIKTTLPFPANIGDTVLLTIYYHGIPQMDASGWGGFYFSADSVYAYNLGVGFAASPHSYGRVWFPCVDEFPEKAYVETYITVKDSNRAVCGGTLESVINNGNNTSTYHWKLHEQIPAYLASVAVSNYVPINDTFQGMTGKIPIQLNFPAAFQPNAATSFVHLKAILGVFENYFGSYRWERVGYVGVPFQNGAMESATNIDYPLFAVNGNNTYETLFAHELSHHWFGDLVTCSTEADIWLNEGWAEYCESVYREGIYGAYAYNANIRANHLSVVETAHVQDGAYYPVYDIPSNITYGFTVYHKGADMLHTLRNYIGDSAFFSSVRTLLNTYKFKNINTLEFRDFLSSQTGINLNDFFKAWVMNPGFPHFSIDSMKVTSVTPQIKSRIWVRQRLDHALAFANSNILEVTFGNNNWQFFTDTIHFSGEFGTKEFTLPFAPDFVMMDYNEKTSDATTDMYKVFKTVGAVNLDAALSAVDVVTVTDSALVRIEHNWVAPDPLKTANTDIKRLSDYHYWKVDGIFPTSFLAKGRFRYNRLVNTSTGNLDDVLLPTNYSMDSIRLLYRKDVSDDWHFVPFAKLGTSTAGYLIVDTLKRGEYTLAVGKPYVTDINEYLSSAASVLNVFPNPSNNLFTFTFNITEKAEIKIFNDVGEEIDSMLVRPQQTSVVWDAKRFEAGSYFARLISSNHTVIAINKLLLVK